VLNIPPGFAQATQTWTLSGRVDPFSVVTGHEVVDPGSGPNDIAGVIRAIWLLHLSPAAGMAVGYALSECRLLYRTPAGVLLQGLGTGSTPGTRAGSNSPPSNCSMLVSKRTGIAGRENRGRMYVPPFLLEEATIDQAGNFPLTNLNTTAAAFLAAFSPDLPMVLLHTSADAPTPVTQLVVRSRLATQRRRMR
jgi:hypothetical protein